MYVTFLVRNPPNSRDIIEVATKLSVALENDMNWELFGMYLLDTTDDKELTLIQHKEEGKPLVNKCRALLVLWKGRNANPKWEQVIEALRNAKLNQLATELEVWLWDKDSKVKFHVNM